MQFIIHCNGRLAVDQQPSKLINCVFRRKNPAIQGFDFFENKVALGLTFAIKVQTHDFRLLPPHFPLPISLLPRVTVEKISRQSLGKK